MVDFTVCENLRDDIIIVDRLHVDLGTLNRRIDELNDEVICVNESSMSDSQMSNIGLPNFDSKSFLILFFNKWFMYKTLILGIVIGVNKILTNYSI